MLSFTADLAERDLSQIYSRHFACGRIKMDDSISGLMDLLHDVVLVENLTTSIFDLLRVRPWLEANFEICALCSLAGLTDVTTVLTSSACQMWEITCQALPLTPAL